MRCQSNQIKLDIFGNHIDPKVGYARGKILKSSFEESLRHINALNIVHNRLKSSKEKKLFNFTGHRRDFSITSDDLENGLAEEYVGMSLVQADLTIAGCAHFGATYDAAVTLFNRASAGIVSSILALVPKGGKVVAVAPKRRTHTSVRLGADLAGAELLEIDSSEQIDQDCFKLANLVVLTRVTSEIDVMPIDDIYKVINIAKNCSCMVFVDDAYGARVAPVFYNQPKTLELPVDFGITSCDKAGLGGPRTGLMAGKKQIIEKVVSRGSEIGFEARAPLLLGVLRTLERYKPDTLLLDAEAATELIVKFKERFGSVYITETFLGPTINEENILSLVTKECKSKPQVVPAEATGALAMILLHNYGILTSAALERPGSRVSLRIKPICTEISRFGGADKFVTAVEDSLSQLKYLVEKPCDLSEILIGRSSNFSDT